jgi:hypothetical protein
MCYKPSFIISTAGSPNGSAPTTELTILAFKGDNQERRCTSRIHHKSGKEVSIIERWTEKEVDEISGVVGRL